VTLTNNSQGDCIRRRHLVVGNGIDCHTSVDTAIPSGHRFYLQVSIIHQKMSGCEIAKGKAFTNAQPVLKSMRIILCH